MTVRHAHVFEYAVNCVERDAVHVRTTLGAEAAAELRGAEAAEGGCLGFALGEADADLFGEGNGETDVLEMLFIRRGVGVVERGREADGAGDAPAREGGFGEFFGVQPLRLLRGGFERAAAGAERARLGVAEGAFLTDEQLHHGGSAGVKGFGFDLVEQVGLRPPQLHTLPAEVSRASKAHDACDDECPSRELRQRGKALHHGSEDGA